MTSQYVQDSRDVVLSHMFDPREVDMNNAMEMLKKDPELQTAAWRFADARLEGIKLPPAELDRHRKRFEDIWWTKLFSQMHSHAFTHILRV